MVNEQTVSMFGYSKNDLVNQKIEILIPQKYRKHHHTHRAHYGENPTPRNMGRNRELLGLKKDGTEFLVEISLSPIEHEVGYRVP